ncbi:unnamed protein product [marine sediment metagenome]|uniref:Uncharacterized protein n=1 Tax=marine sediment metagenome TaxID=412755 RepID=X1N6Y0_9ZZZZ
MKAIMIRPRKFRVEFEELGGGRAKMRYEEELANEKLAEHTLKAFGKAAEGEKYEREGNKIWIEFEGKQGHVLRIIAAEIIMQAMGDEWDAFDLIQEISSNASAGVFAMSEDEAIKAVEEPLDLEKFPKEFLEQGIGELIEGAEKAGVQRYFGGDVGLKGLRQMIKEGVMKEDDKLREALPKIYEYRKRIMKDEK